MVSLLISSLERSGKDLTVLGQSIELFLFAAECKLQLLNQVVFHLELLAHVVVVGSLGLASVDDSILTLFKRLAEMVGLLRDEMTTLIPNGVWTLLVAQTEITADLFTVPLLLLLCVAFFHRL